MENLRFSYNGWVVHLPNPETDVDFDDRGASSFDAIEFAGRRPVLVDEDKRHIYVGAPNWYHGDVGEHHGLPGIWQYGQGYFQGGKVWGNGNLKWYGTGGMDAGAPPYHADVATALQEVGFDIPNVDSSESSVEDEFVGEDWGDDKSWEDVPHYSR